MKILLVFIFLFSRAVSYSTHYAQDQHIPQYNPYQHHTSSHRSSNHQPAFSFYHNGHLIHPLVKVDISDTPGSLGASQSTINSYPNIAHPTETHVPVARRIITVHKDFRNKAPILRGTGNVVQTIHHGHKHHNHYDYSAPTLTGHIVRQPAQTHAFSTFAHQQQSPNYHHNIYKRSFFSFFSKKTTTPAPQHSSLIHPQASHINHAISYQNHGVSHQNPHPLPNGVHQSLSQNHQSSVFNANHPSPLIHGNSQGQIINEVFHGQAIPSHGSSVSSSHSVSGYGHASVGGVHGPLLNDDLHSPNNYHSSNNLQSPNNFYSNGNILQQSPPHSLVIPSHHGHDVSSHANGINGNYHAVENLHTDHHVFNPPTSQSSQTLIHPSPLPLPTIDSHDYHQTSQQTYTSTDFQSPTQTHGDDPSYHHQVKHVDTIHYEHHDPIFPNQQSVDHHILEIPHNTELSFPVRVLRLVGGKPTLDLGAQQGISGVVLQIFSPLASRLIAGIGISITSSPHTPASVCYTANVYTFRYSSPGQASLPCLHTLVGRFVVFDGVTLGNLISVVNNIKVTVAAVNNGGYPEIPLPKIAIPPGSHPGVSDSYPQSPMHDHHFLRHVRLLNVNDNVWQIKFSRLLTVTRVNIISAASPTTYTSLKNIEILISKKRYTNRQCIHNTKLCARNTAPFPPSSHRVFNCQPAQGYYLILRGLDASFRPRDIVRVDVFALERPNGISVQMLEREFHNYGTKIYPDPSIPQPGSPYGQPPHHDIHLTHKTDIHHVVHPIVNPPTVHIKHNIHVDNVHHHIVVPPAQPTQHVTHNTIIKNVHHHVVVPPAQPTQHVTHNTIIKNVHHHVVVPPAQPTQHVTHNTIIKNVHHHVVNPAPPTVHIKHNTHVDNVVHRISPHPLVQPQQPSVTIERHDTHHVINPLHPVHPNNHIVKQKIEIHHDVIHPTYPNQATILHPSIHPTPLIEQHDQRTVIHPLHPFYPNNPTVKHQIEIHHDVSHPTYPNNHPIHPKPLIDYRFGQQHQQTVIHPLHPLQPRNHIDVIHPTYPNQATILHPSIHPKPLIDYHFGQQHQQTVIHPLHPFHPSNPTVKHQIEIHHDVIHPTYPNQATILHPSHPFHPSYHLPQVNGVDQHHQVLIRTVNGGCHEGYEDKLCVNRSMTQRVKECLNTLWQFFSQLNK